MKKKNKMNSKKKSSKSQNTGYDSNMTNSMDDCRDCKDEKMCGDKSRMENTSTITKQPRQDMDDI